MDRPTEFAAADCEDASVSVFLNDRVLQALRIQVSILEARSRPRSSEELESLFVHVESLLRELVREAGAT